MPWQGPTCIRCGLPFPSVHALDSVTPLCSECRQEEYKFDLARSYGLYTDHLREAILLLKFQRRERLGRKLGELLAVTWETLGNSGTRDRCLLVPVPLHPSRERERGFNQAELLAEGLTRELGRTRRGSGPHLETRCLRRTRATVPQIGLSIAARHENVRGVFAVASRERIQERTLVLVDDVMTTGATLSACAAALKRAGAAQVVALTLARATPQFPDNLPAALERVDDSAAQQS